MPEDFSKRAQRYLQSGSIGLDTSINVNNTPTNYDNTSYEEFLGANQIADNALQADESFTEREKKSVMEASKDDPNSFSNKIRSIMDEVLPTALSLLPGYAAGSAAAEKTLGKSAPVDLLPAKKSYSQVLAENTAILEDTKALAGSKKLNKVWNAELGKYETWQENYGKLAQGHNIFGLIDDPIGGNKRLRIDADGAWAKDLNDGYVFYSQKDPETGEYILAKTKFANKEELAKVGKHVISSWGPKTMQQNIFKAFVSGIGNAAVSIPAHFAEAAEATTDLYEAYVSPFRGGREYGKSKDDGISDEISKYLQNFRDISEVPASQNAENNMFSLEALASGVGQGAVSMAEAGITGGAMRGALGKMGLGKLLTKAVGAERASKLFNHIINFGAGSVLNFSEAYEGAKQSGLSEENSALFGMAVGAVNSVVESEIGSNALMDWMTNGGDRVISKTIFADIRRELGEDFGKATKKQFADAMDKAITKSTFNKIRDQFAEFTSRGVIGKMTEEATEEGLQTLVSKASESLYDATVGRDKEVGDGKFGTEFFSKQTMLETLQSALVGGIVGGLGGATMKEGKTYAQDAGILPHIVEGNSEKVKAVVSSMFDAGYLTERQKDNYLSRVDNLTQLWDNNKSSFSGLDKYDNKDLLKAQAASFVNGVFKLENDIDNLNKTKSEVASDSALSDVEKTTRINQINNQIKDIQYNIDFSKMKIEEFKNQTDADGNIVTDKIPAAENWYNNMGDIYNNQFKRFVADQKITEAKAIMADLKTEASDLVDRIKSFKEAGGDTERLEHQLRLNELSQKLISSRINSINGLKGQLTQEFNKLTSDEVQKQGEVKAAEAEAAEEAAPPSFDNTPAPVPVVTAPTIANDAPTENKKSDLDIINEQIAETNEALENDDLDPESVQVLTTRLQELEDARDDKTAELQSKPVEDDGFLEDTNKGLAAILSTDSTPENKLAALKMLATGLVDKAKANTKAGKPNNAEFKPLYDTIQSHIASIQKTIAMNKAAAEKKAAEEKAAREEAKTKADSDKHNAFDAPNRFSVVYRVAALDRDPTAWSTAEANSILTSTPIDQLLPQLVVTFTPIEELGAPFTPGRVQASTANKATKLVDPKLNAVVWFNGKKLGLLPESDKFTINGKPIDWETISEADFKQYLSTTADFAATKALAINLAKLESLGLATVKLGEVASRIAVTDAGVAVQNNIGERVTISAIPEANIEDVGYYIYDRFNSSAIGTPSKDMIYEDGVPAIPDAITERYVVLTKLGNGKFQWITAQQPQMDVTDRAELSKAISEGKKEILANPSDKNIQTAVNQRINQMAFLAGKKGEQIEFVITNKGKVLLQTKIGNTKTTKEIETLSDVDKNMLRKPLAKVATTKEAINTLVVNVTPAVVKSPQLNIFLDSAKIDAMLATKAVETPIAAVDILEEDDDPFAGISAEEQLEDLESGAVQKKVSTPKSDIEARRKEALAAIPQPKMADEIRAEMRLQADKDLANAKGTDTSNDTATILSKYKVGEPGLYYDGIDKADKTAIVTSIKEFPNSWNIRFENNATVFIPKDGNSPNMAPLRAMHGMPPVRHLVNIKADIQSKLERDLAKADDIAFNNVKEYNAKVKAVNDKFDAEAGKTSEAPLDVELYDKLKEIYPNMPVAELEAVTKSLSASNPDALAMSKGNRIQQTKFKALAVAEVSKLGLGGDPAYSISPTSSADVIKLDEAKAWISKVLPAEISVKDLSDLIDNVKNNGVTWGAFADNVIYLAKNAAAGTEYHEAFHAVYRLMLPADQVRGALNLAKSKYGTPTKSMLEKFRSLSSAYRLMTTKELTELWYEEKMADDFKQYTLGKNKESRFRRVWNKLVAWVNTITGNRDELEALFQNINNGRFRNSSLQINRNIPAYSIYTKGVDSENNVVYTSQREARVISTTIAAKTEQKLRASKEIKDIMAGLKTARYFGEREELLAKFGNTVVEDNFEDALNSSIEEYKALYSFDNPYYEKYAEGLTPAEYNEFEAKLLEKISILSDPTNIEKLKADVKKYFEVFKSEDIEAEDSNEATVNDMGERFDVDPWTMGGITSLSQAVRGYIGFATFNDTDEFGQTVERAVDGFTVYKGLTRALAGIDENKMLERFKLHAEFNQEAKAVYDKLISETGITEEDLSLVPNEDLVRRFINAFKNESINWMTILYDKDNGKANVIEANRRSAKMIQFDSWANNFFETSIKLKDADTKKMLGKAVSEIKSAANIEVAKSMDELKSIAKGIATNMRKLGVEVSNGYIVYSLIKRQIEDLGMTLHPDTARVYTSYQNTRGLFDKNFEDLVNINRELQDGFNPYEITFVNKVERGAVTRLENIAEANAIFDETVIDSTFQNADGKNVYSILNPSFGLVKLRELRDPSKRAAYTTNEFVSPDGIVLNHLLSDPNSDEIFQALNQAMFDGFRQTNLAGEVAKEGEGMTFGKFDGKTYLLSELALFVANRKAIKSGNTTIAKTALFNINQMEASNTGYLVSLPVQSFYTKKGMSPKAAQILMDYMAQEFLRINRVATSKNQEIFKNYNDVDNAKSKLRGFKFMEFSTLPGVEVYEELAKKEYGSTQEALDAFRKAAEENGLAKVIEAKIDSDVLEYRKQFATYGIEDSDMPLNDIKALGVDGYIEDNKVTSQFYKDMYLNQYINTLGINNLLLGDYAKGIKDTTDWFKRAKGIIGSGKDLGAGTTNIAVFKEPSALVDKMLNNVDPDDLSDPTRSTLINEMLDNGDLKSIDVSDAQSYVTIFHKMLQMQRWGRYSDDIAEIYNKIINGKQLTWQESEKLASAGAALNSAKTVVYDGEHYLKLSEFPLTPGLVGKTDENGDVIMKELNGFPFPAYPKEGFEYLYNMYEAMIRDGVDQVMPESASKMVTKNPAKMAHDGKFDFSQSITPIENRFKRLQVETPSGKTKITHGTQLIQLVDSEQEDALPIEFPQNPEINTLGKLRDYYRRLLADVRLTSFKEALDYVVDGETDETKVNDLAQKFYETIESSGGADIQMRFFQPAEDGSRKYNWNLGPIVNKAEQLFLAHFTKGVLSQKVPGLKLSLVSDKGMKFNGRELQHMVKDSDGNYYSECLMPAFAKDLLGKDPSDDRIKDVLKMFGIRIPTQDKHSMISLKVVGFLPVEYGSVGVFPKQLVLLSGADFDIDSIYIHRLDYYKDKGKLIPYGTATTPEGKFKEYYTYILSHSREARELVKEYTKTLGHDALKEQMDQLSADLDNEYSRDAFFEIVKTLKEEKPTIIQNMMEDLGYPSTVEEFVKAKPVNPAAANNDMVRAEIKFLTNDYVRNGAALIPATMTSIKAAAKYISEVLDKNTYASSPNTPLERFKANRSNSEGKTGIGPVALSNVVNAFLSKDKIRLEDYTTPITINDKEITGFDGYLDIDGNRKNDNLSSLLSAMTDNAKEQLAAKLNLTMDLLTPVGHMLSIGIPMMETMLIINQPIIRNATRTKTLMGSSRLSFDLLSYIDELKSRFKDEKVPALIAKYSSSINTENLQNSLEPRELAGMTPQELVFQIQIGQLVEAVSSQARYVQSISSLMSLNKGFESTFTDNEKFAEAIDKLQLGSFLPVGGSEYVYDDVIEGLVKADVLRRKDGRLVEGGQYPRLIVPHKNPDSVPFDARLAIVNDPSLFQNILAYNKIRSDVSKRFFISQTPMVRNISTAFGNSKEAQTFISSYVAARAYEKHLQDTSPEKLEEYRQTMNNFGNLLTEKANNLADQLKALKGNKAIFASNKLLRMLRVETPIKGSKVVNITFPTRIKDPDLFNQLSDDYTSLFLNPETKQFAINLYHYVYFKDGLQFKNNSPINIIGNYMFNRMSEGLDKVNEKLLTLSTLDEAFRNPIVPVVTDMFNAYYGDVNTTRRQIEVGRKTLGFKVEGDQMSIGLDVPNDKLIDENYVPTDVDNKTIESINYKFTPADSDSNVKHWNFPYSFETYSEKEEIEGSGIKVRTVTGRYVLDSYQVYENGMVNSLTADQYIQDVISGVRTTAVGFKAVYKKASVKLVGDKAITGGAFGYEAKRIIMQGTFAKTAPTVKSEGPRDLSDAYSALEATPKTYSGTITSLKPNQVFVFGSNPEGRHGAGAAKVARESFGAKYGQGEGMQGQSYALPTKDLRVKENDGLRSISQDQIIKNIGKLYDVARSNPNKEFLIAYSANGSNLNGYSAQEMADMFSALPIPFNIVFEEGFSKLLSTRPKAAVETTSTRPKPQVTDPGIKNYSGNANGSDKFWKQVAGEYGIKTTDYLTTSLDKLTPAQTKEVENAYLKAVSDLGRKVLPASTESGKLVRRDYLQAKAASTILAVGTIVNPGETNAKGYKVLAKKQSVDGGTGYAVQMAINMGKPVFVFNQRDNTWYKAVYTSNGVFKEFLPTSIPTITGKFAGIGTREITSEGKDAIRNVFENSFASVTETSPENLESSDNFSNFAEENSQTDKDLSLYGEIKETTSNAGYYDDLERSLGADYQDKLIKMMEDLYSGKVDDFKDSNGDTICN